MQQSLQSHRLVSLPIATQATNILKNRSIECFLKKKKKREFRGYLVETETRIKGQGIHTIGRLLYMPIDLKYSQVVVLVYNLSLQT